MRPSDLMRNFMALHLSESLKEVYKALQLLILSTLSYFFS